MSATPFGGWHKCVDTVNYKRPASFDSSEWAGDICLQSLRGCSVGDKGGPSKELKSATVQSTTTKDL